MTRGSLADDRVLSELERALDAMGAPMNKRAGCTADLWHGAEPIRKGLWFSAAAQDGVSVPLRTPPQPAVDIAFLGSLTDSSRSYPVYRFRSCGRRQAIRSGLSPKTPTMLASIATLEDEWRVEGMIGFEWSGSRWDFGVPWRTACRDAGSANMLNLAAMANTRTLQRRQEWRLIISEPGQPGLSLTTDPDGVRAFFRDRDVVSGSRRKALLHWVRTHWRRNPTADGGTDVRRHLRGSQAFDWHGYRCEVSPAPEDAPLRALRPTEPGTS